ncbi:glycosyltransferase family 2 protein [Halomonas caseinilytica]|uniref:glycosyltransferase family 2 protein n=1 Tax=Halomonas caseinilytica TaxID=438744 RepID=UPI0008484545|nr:glycosyltransferase family A protein [Halomonas caseinilytica]
MRNHQPTVAIVIPCFNRWPRVCEAIDSVLSQTWLNTHCIVVDDVSTDGSYAQLEEHYRAEPRVSLHQLASNQGQSAARNHGVALSDAAYVGFLDSDDLLVESAVANRMQVAQDDPDFEGLIFSDPVDTVTHRSLLPGKKEYSAPLTLSEYIDDMGWLHTNSFLMKRSAFTVSGGFNEELRKKEDVEFFLRALAREDGRYATGPCCMVRDVEEQRARHDHERIIRQGERFIEAVKMNPILMNRLTQEQAKKLLEADTRSVLQSLYRMKQGKRFRSTLRDAIVNGKLKLDARLLKRYLLSFLR